MIEDSSSFIAFTKHGLSKEAPGWCTEIDFPNQKTKIHFTSWRVTGSSSNLLYVMYNNMGTPLSSSSGPKLQFPSNLRPKLKDPTKMANLSVCALEEPLCSGLRSPIASSGTRIWQLPGPFFSSSSSPLLLPGNPVPVLLSRPRARARLSLSFSCPFVGIGFVALGNFPLL